MNGLESREHDPAIVHLLPQETLTAPSGEQVCALLRETLAHGTAGQPLSARLSFDVQSDFGSIYR